MVSGYSRKPAASQGRRPCCLLENGLHPPDLKGRAEAEKLESSIENEGEIQRYAYLKHEEIIPGHTRLALYAFTTAPYGVLQTAFYIDDVVDLKECLLVWKSVEWTGLS